MLCRNFGFLFFFEDLINLFFREWGRERERQGEKHQCVVASHTPSTRDLAHNPGMCPDWGLNRQPFGSQASAQSTEPHQPGPGILVFKCRPSRWGNLKSKLRSTRQPGSCSKHFIPLSPHTSTWRLSGLYLECPWRCLFTC